MCITFQVKSPTNFHFVVGLSDSSLLGCIHCNWTMWPGLLGLLLRQKWSSQSSSSFDTTWQNSSTSFQNIRHKTGWERHGWIHNMYDLYNTEQQTANQAWINWCYVELEGFLPFNIPHAAGQSYESWYETKRRNIFWFLLAFKMLKYQPPEEGSSSLTACLKINSKSCANKQKRTRCCVCFL